MTHRNRDDGDPLRLLTPREREVLELLRLGLTNGEIAARLEITLDGAKYHVSEIISKLGVRDRHEAASYPERRSPWALALAPIAFLWRQAGALVSVKASSVALVASAGLGAAALGGIGLIVFFLMQGGGGPGEEVSRQVATASPMSPAEAATARNMDPTLRALLDSDTRTALSFCVDRADGSDVTEEEVAAVFDGVRRALAGGTQPTLRSVEPQVSAGCPPPLALTGGPIDYRSSTGLDIPYRSVGPEDVPSPHRFFVYFMGEDPYSATFVEQLPYTAVNAEIRCGGDVCRGLTTAVYVPFGSEAALFEEAGRDLMGLRGPPFPPEPTLDWQGCAEGTNERFYCINYDDCVVPDPDPSCEDFWEMTGLDPPQ